MKYDELIGKLRDCDDYRCDDCELKDEELCNPILMEKAADAIEELQKPKWISVTEGYLMSIRMFCAVVRRVVNSSAGYPITFPMARLSLLCMAVVGD